MHLDFEPSAPSLEDIDFSKFLEVDMRIGEVVEVQDFPEAKKPSYKLKVDFGEGVGVKKSSAQITVHYNKEELIGKKVLAVVNFPPRQIGKFMSEVLVMGFSDSNNDIVLFNLDKDVPNGARLH
ncbi:putative methionine--tRNA ligase, beta subunit [Bacteriovorax sp. BAL6_X]|uniref:tRNA-binding protein n=1 Tax=Bacteriovorax sp. BAL6_X TaxID=1201290 RepID=UPI0003861967|nr:tRNA-binding protein [Bacteriovorax sp. BAL6_X]EPZ49570.1 putative methionine--tRNA ligase, beta subunit [Bacteriovorax sp. BAL6_X]